MHHLSQQSPRVLVVGDLMLDHYLWGSSERISPEAPVPVVEVQREAVLLGGAGNVVLNLQALGAQVVVAGIVGDDETGRQLLGMLQERGVATDTVIVEPGRETSRKTRLVAAHQQVVRFDKESNDAIKSKTAYQLLAAIRSLGDQYDAILISDYNKGVCQTSLAPELIAMARERAIPVLVDPKGNDYRKYRGATLVTPNRKEAALATGINIDNELTLQLAGEQLRDDLSLHYAIITLSEDGLAIFGDRMTRIRAVAREVYDVTGAGDTVLATLGFAMACGEDVVEAAHLANSAAAVVVGKLGSATATLDEITEYDHSLKYAQNIAPIKSLEEIETVADQLRAQKKRIVFTNGCFDLLHRGHVEYLAASRACGDVLIVGVNSDGSVGRNKGPNRPVVSQEDRSFLLAALGSVDYVVIFDQDTPQQLIEAIRPDVLTKGADYTGETVVGSDIAGEVKLIALVDGRSTSSTINRIKDAA